MEIMVSALDIWTLLAAAVSRSSSECQSSLFGLDQTCCMVHPQVVLSWSYSGQGQYLHYLPRQTFELAKLAENPEHFEGRWIHSLHQLRKAYQDARLVRALAVIFGNRFSGKQTSTDEQTCWFLGSSCLQIGEDRQSENLQTVKTYTSVHGLTRTRHLNRSYWAQANVF